MMLVLATENEKMLCFMLACRTTPQMRDYMNQAMSNAWLRDVAVACGAGKNPDMSARNVGVGALPLADRPIPKAIQCTEILKDLS